MMSKNKAIYVTTIFLQILKKQIGFCVALSQMVKTGQNKTRT